jgi:hypothetical protein
MAQQNIDFGTFPNDPNADEIRTAFEKVQENFNELFNNKEEQVYSVNRTPGAGITVNSPTGNVVVTANIAQVRIQSSTLDLSAGVPGSNTQAVITRGTVPFFINLPANVTGVSNINLTGTLVANTVNVNLQINGNTASFSGNITTSTNINASNVYTSRNLDVAGITSLGVIGNVKITGGSLGQFIGTDGTGNLAFNAVGQATNVLYVSKSGNDSNDGTSLNTAKLTIKAAVTAANALQALTPSGVTAIFVKAGDYTEANPISMSAGVSIVGDNLRAATVRPSTPTQDIFWVKNRCYITGLTFRGHLTPAAAIAFPSTGAGAIVTSPYIQNCSSLTTTGCGIRIDGNLALGLKSMVMDSFTQFNQGGIGVHVINQGYAQLVSIFTICCTEGVKCESGGSCSITNSNNSFGNYGLYADGTGPTLYSGTLVSNTKDTMTIGGLSQRPAVGDGFLVAGSSQYLAVRESTALVAGVSIVAFAETLLFTPTPGATVDFLQLSLISASNQTFEYIGTGTSILTATPRLGGIPIQANEVFMANGGRVNYTSTDQFGDFRVGEGLMINEVAGVIEGTTFDKSLFAVLTPYILALENN